MLHNTKALAFGLMPLIFDLQWKRAGIEENNIYFKLNYSSRWFRLTGTLLKPI